MALDRIVWETWSLRAGSAGVAREYEWSPAIIAGGIRETKSFAAVTPKAVWGTEMSLLIIAEGDWIAQSILVAMAGTVCEMQWFPAVSAGVACKK